MGHFFIKRGNNLHGPYSESQIQSVVDTGKLKASDFISETWNGPWQSINQFHVPKVDEEAIAGDGKIRRVMDSIRADLEKRRQIPTEAGPVERAGTDWIRKGVELYLDEGHAACFMYSVMETDLPALRPSDKLGLNRMMLATVIEEACNHINGTDEVC